MKESKVETINDAREEYKKFLKVGKTPHTIIIFN